MCTTSEGFSMSPKWSLLRDPVIIPTITSVPLGPTIQCRPACHFKLGWSFQYNNHNPSGVNQIAKSFPAACQTSFPLSVIDNPQRDICGSSPRRAAIRGGRVPGWALARRAYFDDVARFLWFAFSSFSLQARRNVYHARQESKVTR